MASTAVNFKESISDPIARDIGNKTLQGRTVSKTLKFGLFTTNENAVWAANNQLRKEAYPFANLKLVVNRNVFNLKVGDVFKLTYTKYGITDMICRVLLKEEDNLNSENITLHVMEDVFGVSSPVTQYTDPTLLSIAPPEYTVTAFTQVNVVEAPYALSENIAVVAMAKREESLDLGFVLHMSIDSGSSFNQIDQNNNIQVWGQLNTEYELTNPIDDSTTGISVNFPTTDIDNVESITWANTLAGQANLALIENEIISFQTITPVSGTNYTLKNVIRARYGTQQAVHAANAEIWILSKNIAITNSTEIAVSTREFKLVPFNRRATGAIADATEVSLAITGLAKTPYKPSNFNANGASFAARYVDDIVLTWNARKRGEGAGIGIPGIVLANSDQEGLFDVRVYVSSILVRSQTDIIGLTWTYTEAMNISDNGSLASEIEFRVDNHREETGTTYTSNYASVTVKL